MCALTSTVAYAADFGWNGSVGVHGGFRKDELKWNIAGTPQGHNPNILSELKWTDLEIRQIQATGNLRLTHRSFLWARTQVRIAYGYGDIFDGKNQDADYLGDDRTDRNSLIINDAGDGDVRDFTVSFGPSIQFKDDRWTFVPKLGYSYHEQNLTLFDGKQVDPSLILIPDLNSTYQTEWDGPWAGLDIVYKSNNWSLTSRVEYHSFDYYAEADWNLRSDFQHPKSFDHRANGNGIVLDLEWVYQISEHFSLSVLGHYLEWKTDHGVDRLFLANGDVLPTRLNKVTWESMALNVGLVYNF